MGTQIATVDFHGQTILAIQNDNEIRVAIKPICENIGLQWEAQLKRIKRHPVLSQGMSIMDIPSAGGEQETTTLPLEMLNGWLFGVDANRVSEEVRPKLIEYQRECFKVLYSYWNNGIAENPRQFSVGIHDSLTKEQADSLRDMVKRNADKLEKPYQGAFCVKAWAKLKAHFKCGYRDIPRSEYTTALSILSRHIVDYGLELEAPKTSELTKEYVAMCHRKAVTAGNSISSAILQMLLEGRSEELDIEAFRITFAGGTPWVSRLPMLR